MNKTLVAFALLLATSFAYFTDDVALTNTLASTAGIVVYGAASDKIGWTVADAGDFNGDSKDDYLIGTSVGKAYLIFGLSSARTAALNLASSSLTKSEVLIFSFAGNTAKDVVVSAAGDMNKDGYDDIALGLPEWDGDASGTAVTSQGLVAVYYGISATAVSALSSATQTLTPASDTTTASSAYFYIRAAQVAGSANFRVGASIASVGDLVRDANNIDDLLVGAPGVATNDGAAYLIVGKPKTSGTNTRTTDVVTGTLVADTNGFPIAGISGGADKAGFSVAGIGDINGDTYPDALVGTNANLRAFIIYGGTSYAAIALLATSASTSDKFTVLTGEASSGFGYRVGSAGDINDNDVNDFFVTAPLHTTNTGRLYIFKGKTGGAEFADADFTVGDSMTTAFVFKGVGQNTYFGLSADGGIGMDFNNDGVDDMVSCAPGAATPTTGQTATTYTGTVGKCYVLFGKTTIATADLSATPLTTTALPYGIMISGVSGSGFGKDVSVIGDVTGDGADDFAVTASYGTYTGVTSSGLVYEFHGGSTPSTTTTGSGFRLGASLLIFVSFFAALML